MIKINGKSLVKGQINGKEIQKIVINGNTVWTSAPVYVEPTTWSVNNNITMPQTGNGFYARYIWSIGDNVYYSYTTNQKVYNKTNNTWSNKTWSGLTRITANRMFFIKRTAISIYYANNVDSKMYQNGVATATLTPGNSWSQVTMTDGQPGNSYYDMIQGKLGIYRDKYTFNPSTNAFTQNISVEGETSNNKFSVNFAFVDGEHIYGLRSNGGSTAATYWVELDEVNKIWKNTTINGNSQNASGQGYISGYWTDGYNVYATRRTNATTPATYEQVKYDRDTKSFVTKVWSGINNNVGALYTFTIDGKIYMYDGTNVYQLDKDFFDYKQDIDSYYIMGNIGLNTQMLIKSQ